MVDTVRERILQQWHKNLDSLQNQEASSDLFQLVSREPLDRSDFTGAVACALIDEGEDVAVYETGYLQMDMIVSVEFWIRMKRGCVASTELNEVAGLITREFLGKINTDEDVTNEQLSLNIQPQSLDFDIDGVNDTFVAGVRSFRISYRHKKQDPYLLA